MEIKSYEDLLQAELNVIRGGQRLLVSVFLIDNVLIDTGPSRKDDYLIPLFEKWEIQNVILTHHHEDHTGLANWLQHNQQVKIYMHENGIEKCKIAAKLPLYRHLFWGKREPFEATPLGKTFQTDYYTWDIIHTPGHADDHIALFNREKGWLFGGDLFVNPKPKSFFKFESVPEIIHSLRKVLAYDFETYICSHAGVLFEGKNAIKKKLDYLISKQQEVLFLYNKGMSPKQIRKQSFPSRHPIHYFSLFECSPMHFIHSVING
ncbi:MBL fold metallo-hydrolase [Pseudogracilibacillus sp. SO30301A]|uniref:MBL fold metallo-hydrolase n=1 Tax=Pseudogracilibacillus sp. SO30301A TaxID=3098291 RepID=UPI00300E04BA